MRTQVERDEEFRSHKPYTGFTCRDNLASFRRPKSRMGHPLQPEDTNQTEGATEREHQLGDAEGEGLEHLPTNPSDPDVMHQPVATPAPPNLPEQGK